MKAFLETAREKTAAHCDAEVIESSEPDSNPDWKYPDEVAKQRIAA